MFAEEVEEVLRTFAPSTTSSSSVGQLIGGVRKWWLWPQATTGWSPPVNPVSCNGIAGTSSPGYKINRRLSSSMMCGASAMARVTIAGRKPPRPGTLGGYGVLMGDASPNATNGDPFFLSVIDAGPVDGADRAAARVPQRATAWDLVTPLLPARISHAGTRISWCGRSAP